MDPYPQVTCPVCIGEGCGCCQMRGRLGEFRAKRTVLGNGFRQLRKERGESIHAAAARLGISVAYLSRCERGLEEAPKAMTDEAWQVRSIAAHALCFEPSFCAWLYRDTFADEDADAFTFHAAEDEIVERLGVDFRELDNDPRAAKVWDYMMRCYTSGRQTETLVAEEVDQLAQDSAPTSPDGGRLQR